MPSHFQNLQASLQTALKAQVSHWMNTAPESFDEDGNAFYSPFDLTNNRLKYSMIDAFRTYKQKLLENLAEVAGSVRNSFLTAKRQEAEPYKVQDHQKKLMEEVQREFPELKSVLSGSTLATQMRIDVAIKRRQGFVPDYFSIFSADQKNAIEASGIRKQDFNKEMDEHFQDYFSRILTDAASFLEKQGNKDIASKLESDASVLRANKVQDTKAAEEKAFLDKILRMQPDPAKWIITKGLFKGKSLQYVHDVVTGDRKDDGMMHKAAQWILNTHAAMNADPANFSANFVVRGISEKVQREGAFDKAFYVMFRAADKKLGMVEAASTQLSIPEVGESDRERTRIRKSFYKDKRGRNRSSDRVTYVPPSEKEGEGFAVSDVEKNRGYNRRVSNQETDMETRKKRALRKIGIDEYSKTSRTLPNSMDPNAKAEYLRIEKMLEQMPARPVKEVYKDPVTGEMKKGYRVRLDEPAMITYDKNGFPRFIQPDYHRLTRKNLHGRLKAMREEARADMGLDVHEQMRMVQEIGGRSLLDLEAGGRNKKRAGKGGRVIDKPDVGTEKDGEDKEKNMGLQSPTILAVYAKRIQGATSHNALDRLQSEMYEEMASKSGIGLFIDPTKSVKERRLIASQLIDLAQISDAMGGDANFPLTKKGGSRFDDKDLNQLVQTFESGTQVNRTTTSLFRRQGEAVHAAGTSVDLDLMPTLPIKTQVAVRKMQLNNEGSTT